MSDSLITKYRPTSFDTMIGHKDILKSLKNVLSKKLAQSFIFTGPAGTGKTTLARIIAKEVGCKNPVEVDAATYTGIDAMRGITSDLGYKPLIGETKVIIIDEAHRLSDAAMTSLLKSIEEPSSHVYWILCTTDVDKIKKAVITRCQNYTLKPLKDDDVADLLLRVCDEEAFKTPEEVLEAIIEKADGSPRQALSFLATVSECQTKEEALPFLNGTVESKAVIDLCRFLVKEKNPKWHQVQRFIVDLKSENGESIRLNVVNYIAAVLSNTRDDQEVTRLLNILSAFKTPYYQSEKVAPLILSLGEIVYS